jgi:hypothetical protein
MTKGQCDNSAGSGINGFTAGAIDGGSNFMTEDDAGLRAAFYGFVKIVAPSRTYFEIVR